MNVFCQKNYIFFSSIIIHWHYIILYDMEIWSRCAKRCVRAVLFTHSREYIQIELSVETLLVTYKAFIAEEVSKASDKQIWRETGRDLSAIYWIPLLFHNTIVSKERWFQQFHFIVIYKNKKNITVFFYRMKAITPLRWTLMLCVNVVVKLSNLG